MITCTRRIQFCAGHRVLGHEGKCAELHGHNYVALLTAQQVDQELDNLGRVLDFSVLKNQIGGWVESSWDHGMILWDRDSAAIEAMDRLGHAKVFLLPRNPTAEELARYLLLEVAPVMLKGTGVRLVRVELWETENCRAEVSL